MSIEVKHTSEELYALHGKQPETRLRTFKAMSSSWERLTAAALPGCASKSK